MSFLFFLMSLAFGWLAWNLYHPVFHSPRLAVPSFLAGWLTGELALHVIFWQAIIVSGFAFAGGVWGFFGAVGLLICIASWGAMAFYYHESTGAKDEVAGALAAGLGDDFLSEVKQEYQDRFTDRPDPALIRRPFRHRDPLVEVIKDLPFGDYGQTLDIRRAKAHPDESARPVLLQIHGGAWTENYGSKNEQGLPLMNHMAKRGWICAATSYRLSPGATFPEHIIDCKQALVWLRDRVADYGGDADFIAVTGGSAGGHLAALLALSANHAPFQPGFEDCDTSVQCAVPFYGVYDFTDAAGNNALLRLLENSVLKLALAGNEAAFREASPLFHIDAGAPPFFVIHGDRDNLVPVRGAAAFAEKLKQHSNNKVVYLELAGAQHAFDVFPSARSEYVKLGVERFLAWCHSRHLSLKN